MKKIIIFYPFADTFGGIERIIISFISSINKRKINYEVVCFRSSIKWKKYNNEKSINLKILGGTSIIDRVIKFRNYYKQANCIGKILCFGEKGTFFAYLSGLKNFTVHYTDPPQLNSRYIESKNFFSTLKRKLALKVCNLGLLNSKSIIVTTKKNRHDIKKIFNVSSKVVYPAGFNFYKKKKFPVKTLFKNDKINLLSIGRLSPNRNIDWLIDLINFCKLNEKILYKKLMLNIVGDGEKKNTIINLVKQYNLQDKIKFYFTADDYITKKILLKSDIFLLPAVQGYGLPALEALYMNIPVVSNQYSRISEILKKNPWVSLTKNHKKDFIKKSIIHIKNMKLKLPNYKILYKLPTEESFSTDVGKICGWWK